MDRKILLLENDDEDIRKVQKSPSKSPKTLEKVGTNSQTIQLTVNRSRQDQIL